MWMVDINLKLKQEEFGRVWWSPSSGKPSNVPLLSNCMVDANQSSPTNSGKKVTWWTVNIPEANCPNMWPFWTTSWPCEGCSHFESGGGLQAAAERPQCGRLRVPQGLGRLWASEPVKKPGHIHQNHGFTNYTNAGDPAEPWLPALLQDASRQHTGIKLQYIIIYCILIYIYIYLFISFFKDYIYIYILYDCICNYRIL